MVKDVHRVVYHNNGVSGGADEAAAYASRLVGSLRNHLAAVPDATLVVVSHGAGFRLFELTATDAALGEAVADLRRAGVRFAVCNNTLRTRRLAPEDLPGVVAADVVPSGVVEIARLQLSGYAYLHL
jgi:intracellular sulfur oxidation DsrE/DsrF family protein